MAFQVTVVIPAHNEADFIAARVATLRQVFSDRRLELIVVDDASEDGTSRRARPALGRGDQVLRLPRPAGKGAAVIVGVLASRGRVVAYTDADADISAASVKAAYDHFLAIKADVVVAEKHYGDDTPLLRRAVSLGFRVVRRAIVPLPVRDTQTGLKVMRGALAREVAARVKTPGYLFDVELLWRLALAGASIEAWPVGVAMSRPASRLQWADFSASAAELVQLWHLRRHGDTGSRPRRLAHAHLDA